MVNIRHIILTIEPIGVHVYPSGTHVLLRNTIFLFFKALNLPPFVIFKINSLFYLTFFLFDRLHYTLA